MSLVYLDTETTGLDPAKHQVWEIAFAIDDGPIFHGHLPHDLSNAEVGALRVGRYVDRYDPEQPSLVDDELCREALNGATLVGANPAFDAAFLRARWGAAPWRYRLLDVEAYAMGALGYDEPQGLKTVAQELKDRGYFIPTPDHTAAGDVATLRACHLALRRIYEATR